MNIKRGQIVLVDLGPIIGSEQGKVRPALVIQNDEGNQYSPITIIAPITSKIYKKQFPTNIEIEPKDSGLKNKSTILFNQIRAIDKKRIIKRKGILNSILMQDVDFALKVSLGLI